MWEGPQERVWGVCVCLVGGAPRETGSWGSKSWHRRKGLVGGKARGKRILGWQIGKNSVIVGGFGYGGLLGMGTVVD